MPQIKKKETKVIDLADLRERIEKHKEDGEKIISHFNKMQEYYSNWEDRLLVLEKEISEAESTLGLTKEEVTEYNALDSAFS